MARIRLGLTLALVAVLSGCSLLVKEVTLPPCTSDTDCEVLNAVAGDKPITRCDRFQCTGNPGNPGACVYRPLDSDDDGHVAESCGGDDCDDANSEVHGDHEELCDGLDNNCDLVIDDGDFSGTLPSQAFETTNGAGLTWGTAGSGAYNNAAKATFTFVLDGAGVIKAAAEVLPFTNEDRGFDTLAAVDTQAGCAARAASWAATAPCAGDVECPAPRCTWGRMDGGGINYDAGTWDGGWTPAGTCDEVDGGFDTVCTNDSNCAWACATERCVPPHRGVGENDVQVDLCEFAELATSPSGSDGAFAVGIQTNGCNAGRLRAGWLDNQQHLQMFGPEARSNVWLGVDVGTFPSDGGALSPACSGAERGVPGATRPAVAALDLDPVIPRPQALAVYLGDARTRNRCGDAVPVPVQGIGLWKEDGRGTLSAWVTGTQDGHPETFGETNGGGAPAVAAIGQLGWIVGYPEAATTPGTPIALHYVGTVARPTPYTELGPDGGITAAHARRSTASLDPAAPFLTLPASGRADYVSVAVGALRGSTYDLGVTWMEGCANDGAETVWFSLVHVDPAAPDGATATDPVQLSTPIATGGFPTVVYAGSASRFVRPTWTRPGGDPVALDALSGFVVAWAGAGRLAMSSAVWAIRVMEADGLPLDAAPLNLTPAGGASAASVVTYAPPGAADGHISYSYWDNATQVMGAPLICPPR
jgi:hypothetical protein